MKTITLALLALLTLTACNGYDYGDATEYGQSGGRTSASLVADV